MYYNIEATIIGEACGISEERDIEIRKSVVECVKKLDAEIPEGESGWSPHQAHHAVRNIPQTIEEAYFTCLVVHGLIAELTNPMNFLREMFESAAEEVPHKGN